MTERKLLFSLAFLAMTSPLGCAGDSARVSVAPPMQDETVVGDYLKARFAANLQQLDVAANAYARASEAAPQDALLLRHAFFYELAAGNVDAAGDLAAQLIKPEYRDVSAEDDPADVMRQAMAAARAQQSLSLPILTVAAVQMRDGDYEDALQTLKQDKDSAYAQSISYLMEAWAVFETEGTDAGLAMLSDTQNQTFTGFTPLHRALMLEAAGRDDDAKQAFAEAEARYPSEQTRIARAEFVERTGDRQEAQKLYAQMVEDDTTLVRTGRLGLIRLGAPLAGETREMIREAKRYRPRRTVDDGAEGAGLALYHFAWASYRQAMQEQAAAQRAGFFNMPVLLNTPLAFAQLSAHLKPDFEASDYLIGGIYHAYEMNDAAIEAFRQVSFNDAFYEYATSDLASALVDVERQDDAVALLADYVETDAFAVSTALRLAGLLSDNGQNEAARETLTQAIHRIEAQPEDERSGDLWRYYFARGVQAHENGDWDSAEADLVTARDFSGGEPYVLNYLGYSWVERGENLDEAFDMIETALEEEPNSGAITDSLGWAYYMMGEYDTAIDYLERAVMLEPADPVITDHLGDAYWQTGRRIEAKYEWRRALSYEPDEDLATVLKRKLTEGFILTADSMPEADPQ